MIATRGNALAEVLGDAGLLVAPDDPSDTAAAITRVLEDDELRAELVRRGPRRVETMTWTNTAREHASIYRELVASAA